MAMFYVSTNFLVPLSEIKIFLSVTDTNDDDVIGFIAQAMAEFIDVETNRTIISSSVTEYHDGEDTDCIRVRQYPINTVAASMQVWIDPTAQFSGDEYQIPVTQIAVQSTAGLVFYVNGMFPRGRQNIKLAFAGGWAQADVPGDLKLAFLALIQIAYRNRSNKDWEVESMSSGDISRSVQLDIPAKIERTLQKWRRHG